MYTVTRATATPGQLFSGAFEKVREPVQWTSLHLFPCSLNSLSSPATGTQDRECNACTLHGYIFITYRWGTTSAIERWTSTDLDQLLLLNSKLIRGRGNQIQSVHLNNDPLFLIYGSIKQIIKKVFFFSLKHLNMRLF